MTDNTQAAIRLSAMNALARREHSRVELARKLKGKFPEEEGTIEAVLERLGEEGLQSDQRFAESYCRSRVNRGYGQRHICYDLQQKGVSEGTALAALESLELDWFQQALTVLRKKFGFESSPDLKEKARRQRFLHYRGFGSEQIRYALELQGTESQEE